MGTRDALIVAVARYRDAKLRRLRAPAADADRLRRVLADPAVGDFRVAVASDESEADLRRRLARFFSARAPDDLLVLHFSCHGVKDDKGELYLAAADTDSDPDLLSATAIASGWLDEQIDRCRSKRIVVLLDCCFSGSFRFGLRARAGGTVDVGGHLGGRGRAVITASNSMEYAFEGDRLTGTPQPSIFTGAVVEALETGKADRDQDGWISVDELYDYVYDRVREQTPGQTPTKLGSLEGPLYIARSSYRAPVEQAAVDPRIIENLESQVPGVRLGAVEQLARLLETSDPVVVRAARQALERANDGLSEQVAEELVERLGPDPTLRTQAAQAPEPESQPMPERTPAPQSWQAPKPPQEPARAVASAPQAVARERHGVRAVPAVGVGLAAIAAVVVALAISRDASQRAGESEVRSVLRRYEEATQDKDYQTLCDDLLSTELVERTRAAGLPCEVSLRTGLEDRKNVRLRVLDVDVNGDEARARVRSSAQGEPTSVETIQLVHERGWRVAALAEVS